MHTRDHNETATEVMRLGVFMRIEAETAKEREAALPPTKKPEGKVRLFTDVFYS